MWPLLVEYFENLNDKTRSFAKDVLMGDDANFKVGKQIFQNNSNKAGRNVAFINCNLFDGECSQLKSDMVILVEKDRIISVNHSGKISIPEGYFIVDARGRLVMPGLIDSHVHLSSPFTYEGNISAIRQMRRQIAFNNIRTVYSGVTTVCDMGGPPGIIKEFQNYSDSYTIAGPRSLNCFTMISPRHGRRLGYPTQVKPIDPFKAWLIEGQVSTRPKCIKELKKICYKVKDDGGTHLKITYQQQPFSAKAFSQQNLLPLFNDEWMKEIFRIAKEVGMVVNIHSPFGKDAEKCVDLAIEADTKIRIHHMVFDMDLDEAILKKMHDNGCYLIPTVMIYGDAFQMPAFISWLDNRPERHLTPEAGRQLRARIQKSIDVEPLSGQEVLELDNVFFRKQFDIVRRNTQKAHAAGVLGFGTDLGGTYTGFFGRLHSEVEHYSDFGISASDILKYATSVNAKINDLNDRGVIKPGKMADIIMLDGNHINDFKSNLTVVTVMKGGVFLKFDGLELN